MEAIGVIVLIWIGWSLFSWLVSAGTRTAGAAGKAALGKGSFSENMDLAFKGMGDLELRVVDSRLGEEQDGPRFKAIEIKGLIPVSRKTNLGVMISAFDSTDGDWKPVLASLEGFQEPDTAAFQTYSDIGTIEPNQGYTRWVRLGGVIPEIIQPAVSGERNISVVVRLIDMDNPPEVRVGFNRDDSESDILALRVIEFDHFFSEKGYEEAAEHRDEAAALTVKIGVAVAMADGTMDDSEGNVLKHWIQKAISPFSESKQAELKSLYNHAFRESYQEAANGDLVLSNLTERLEEIGEQKSKYDAIELCFEVMAADGIADTEELNTIHKIADALGLDIDEVARMRDQKIVDLDASYSDSDGVESLLGIDSNWPKDQIKRHLRGEFQKWNNRLNTLPEGDERNNAQTMLDMIAQARKKYA